MKQLLSILSLATLLVGCGSGSKKNKLTKDDLNELIAQELKNQERAKHGNQPLNIETISNSAEVEKLREEIKINILHKKNKELASEKNKSIGEKYKAGDKSVIPEIIKTLKGNDAKAKRVLYFDLQKGYDEKDNYNITEPELIKLILEKIDSPDEKEAVQLAAYNKLPGALKKIESRFLSGKSEDKGRLFFWISQEGTNASVLNYATNEILSGKINLEEDNYYLSGLEYFAEKGTPQMREHVLKTCYEIKDKKLIKAEKFEEIKASYSSDNPAIDLLNILLKYGDQKVTALALDLIKNEILEEQSLETLVRLEGKKHRELIVRLLNDKKKFFYALPSVITLYKTTNDKALVEKMLIQFEKNNDNVQYKTDRVVKALTDMGTNDYFDKLETIIKDKKLADDMKQSYKLSTISIEQIAKDALEMGLTDKAFDTGIFKKDKKEGDESERPSATDILDKLGIYMWFDAEIGMVPVDYDKLIMDFAAHSNGKFKDPIVWMDAKENPGGETYDYKITMIFNNKAYIVKPEDIGDWYDVEIISGFINKALSDAGIPEKFVFIDTGDQTVQFIFGKEENVKKFAKKYQLY